MNLRGGHEWHLAVRLFREGRTRRAWAEGVSDEVGVIHGLAEALFGWLA